LLDAVDADALHAEIVAHDAKDVILSYLGRVESPREHDGAEPAAVGLEDVPAVLLAPDDVVLDPQSAGGVRLKVGVRGHGLGERRLGELALDRAPRVLILRVLEVAATDLVDDRLRERSVGARAADQSSQARSRDVDADLVRVVRAGVDAVGGDGEVRGAAE